MKNNLPATKEDITELRGDFTGLQKDFTSLRRDFTGLRGDFASLQRDFKDFKEQINEKINLLPTKKEFFSRMDKVMGELQTIREEQIVSGHQLSDHEDRIIVLEQKTGIATV